MQALWQRVVSINREHGIASLYSILDELEMSAASTGNALDAVFESIKKEQNIDRDFVDRNDRNDMSNRNKSINEQGGESPRSVQVSVYMVYLSIGLSVYLSICLSVYLSICLSVYR